jgi:protein TonB
MPRMNPALHPSVTHRRQLLALGAAGAASLLAGCSLLPGRHGAAGDPVYRRAAANHIYAKYPDRIHKGKLPPMLYAIGVLEVMVDTNGRVLSLRWLRAPNHAPEVVSQIERLVRQAAPFPAPRARTGYIDTWLWDRSGRFQLDTLTEGQLAG